MNNHRKFLETIRKAFNQPFISNDKVTEIQELGKSLISDIQLKLFNEGQTGENYLIDCYKENMKHFPEVDKMIMEFMDHLKEGEVKDAEKESYDRAKAILGQMVDTNKKLVLLSNAFTNLDFKKYVPECIEKNPERINDVEIDLIIREILENPFEKMIYVNDKIRYQSRIKEPFKVYGNVSYMGRFYQPSFREKVDQQFEGNLIGMRFLDTNSKKGYGIFRPTKEDLDGIEYWKRTERVSELLQKLGKRQFNLTLVKISFVEFENTKERINKIVAELKVHLAIIDLVLIKFFEPNSNLSKAPHLVKTKNEGNGFESLFPEKEDMKITITALKKLQIINEENIWIYSDKKKNAILAVISVLKLRGRIEILPDEVLAEIFAATFNTTISPRSIYNRPAYYDDLVRELKTLIPEK